MKLRPFFKQILDKTAVAMKFASVSEKDAKRDSLVKKL